MANTTSATKLAIAKLEGKDLPRFVPRFKADEVAKLVRECVFQAGKIKVLKISESVVRELNRQIGQCKKPKYTISQYLLMLLCSASTTSKLIKLHDAGLISDSELIEGIKGGTTNNIAAPRKVGGKKVATNACDRAGNANEVHKTSSTKIP